MWYDLRASVKGEGVGGEIAELEEREWKEDDDDRRCRKCRALLPLDRPHDDALAAVRKAERKLVPYILDQKRAIP